MKENQTMAEQAQQLRLAADIVEFGHKWKAIRTLSCGKVQSFTSDDAPFSARTPTTAIEIGYTISILH